MRALQFCSSRLRALVVGAALVLGAPSAAWSAIHVENAWSGPFEGLTTILGVFTTSDPQFTDATADIDPVNPPLWVNSAWSGPDGTVVLTYGNWVQVPGEFEQYTGVFSVDGAGSTGIYENSTGEGTVLAVFFAGRAFAFNQGSMTLIPEPAVWFMLAAGLGLLGFVRIRRAARGGF